MNTNITQFKVLKAVLAKSHELRSSGEPSPRNQDLEVFARCNPRVMGSEN